MELFPRPDAAYACARIGELMTASEYRVRLLRPLAEDGVSHYKGSVDRGGDFHMLVAICFSDLSHLSGTSTQGRGSHSYSAFDELHSGENVLQWDGVYEREEENSSSYKPKKMLLI